MRQRTIKEAFTTSGIGLHSGKTVILDFSPSQSNSGIVFKRTDLKNAKSIKVDAFAVKDTMMSTNLIDGDTRIGTVEHLLSALAGLGIDNLNIGVSDTEVPIMDGSAESFIKQFIKAGIVEQEHYKQFIKLKKSIRIQELDKWAELVPYDGFQINFEINFKHPAFADNHQKSTLDFSTKNYISQLSRARTFGFLKDINNLRHQGLALGGSLQNAIVLDDISVLNEEGLRFEDEFVRHKMLDAIGDLYLCAKPLLAQFNGYKSGHTLNNQLVRKMLEDKSSYEIVTIYDHIPHPIDYSLPSID